MFKNITGYQERDTCLALTFLLLLFWCFFRHPGWIYVAMALLLVGMIYPKAMRPLAAGWYWLANALGGVVSTVLLGAVWLVMVVPVGYIRKKMGKDDLGLKQWRNGEKSAFVVRDHTYDSADLKNPY